MASLRSSLDLQTNRVRSVATEFTGRGGLADALQASQAESGSLAVELTRLDEILEKLSGAAGKGGGAIRSAIGDNTPDFLSQVSARVTELNSTVGQLGSQMAQVQDQMSSAFAPIVTGSTSAREAVGQLLASFAGSLAQSAGRQLFGAIGRGIGIPGLATGTSFAPGGLAVVGERGPEVVNLPRGSQVFSNEQSRRMGGGVTVAPVFNLDLRGAQAGTADTVVNALRARLPPDVERVAVAAVRNSSRRGV